MFDLNDDTRWILGRPNFACGGIAQALRVLGQSIECKAEAEQAAVIHWMLTLWEAHGAGWREAADRVLSDAARVARKNAARKASSVSEDC